MMELPWIVLAGERIRVQTDQVGGKAATLLQLADREFPVPPFFILTTRAYFEQLQAPQLGDSLKRWQEAASEEDRLLAGGEIAKLLTRLPLPPAVIAQIQEGADKLGVDEPAAVRSSATVEDLPGHSFAGVFTSKLGVVGVRAIEAAVRQVWASLWGPAALAYFRRVGIDPLKAGMAVIVQKLVPARASGVAFGITGAEEPVRVECISGLGLPLVSGEVEPDRFVVDVREGRVRKRSAGTQGKALTAEPRGGLKWRAPSRPMDQPAIDDRTAVRIAEEVLAVQQALGYAADIEWLVDEAGGLHLVQARPITVGLRRSRPRRVWTGYFFLERFPTPISPLGWDLLRGPVEQRAFRDPLTLLGYSELAGAELTRLFWGRPYTDLRVFRALYGWIPQRFLSQDKRDLLDGRADERLTPVGLLRFGWRCLRSDGNALFPLHLRLWRRFVPKYTAAVEELGREDLASLGPGELRQRLQRALQLTDDYLKLHRWSLTYADLFFQLVHWCARRWLRWSAVQTAELVIDPSGDRTAVMNLELAELAQQARRQPESWSRLKQGELGSSPLARQLQDFLRRYGHRSTSLDPAVPNWSDDPRYVLELIERLKPRRGKEDSLEAHRDALRSQRKREGEFLSRVPWLFRPLCRGLLRIAQRFVLLRENERFYWQMSIAQMRRICLEIGRRLVQSNAVSTESDVFFLQLEELDRLLLEGTQDFRKVIAERRRQFRRDARLTPAQRLLETEEGRVLPEAAPIEGNRLTGLAISPGRASGRARIVPDLNAFRRLRSGDILVTRSLDPGWTPVLGLVAGVVLEVGGMLSHGSILAREFGVPGVSNIPGLLGRIRDGDALFVDGDRGEVIVGQPAPESSRSMEDAPAHAPFGTTC